MKDYTRLVGLGVHKDTIVPGVAMAGRDATPRGHHKQTQDNPGHEAPHPRRPASEEPHAPPLSVELSPPRSSIQGYVV